MEGYLKHLCVADIGKIGLRIVVEYLQAVYQEAFNDAMNFLTRASCSPLRASKG